VDVETADVLLARWRDGLIVYLKSYASKDEALGDLGVSKNTLEPISADFHAAKSTPVSGELEAQPPPAPPRDGDLGDLGLAEHG
jgi:hypothetical protein